MNVRYYPVPSEMNTPDAASPSTPFLPSGSAPPATRPSLTLPTLPTLPALPSLPDLPNAPSLKSNHTHRLRITVLTSIYIFLFYLCVEIWGDNASTLLAWLLLGIVTVVLGCIWQPYSEWFAEVGRRTSSHKNIGVDQKMMATGLVALYTLIGYAVFEGIQSWWLCIVGEIGLLVAAVMLVDMWMDERYADCGEETEREVETV